MFERFALPADVQQDSVTQLTPLIPPDVQARLSLPADYDLLRTRGPVNDDDAGTVLSGLSDLAAQAIVHDQRPLALALCQAVSLLTQLTATEVAEVA